MVKKVDSYSLAARQEKLGYESSSHQLITCKNVTVILVVAIGFVLYTRFLLQDVVQRANFPGFLSPNSPAVDNLYYSYSEEASIRDGLKSPGLAPAASPIHRAESSNQISTKSGDDTDSMNVDKKEDAQDKSPTNTITNVGPPATPVPDGNNLNRTTTQPMDGSNTDMNLQTHYIQDGSLANSTTSSPTKFSVLVGVFIMAYEMKRREIIRLAYSVQSSEYADFTVRFIMGGYQLESWLEWENATHGDMIVLQCMENMNDGKSFTYFSTLPDLGYRYDYVMKTDDDAYLRFENLGKHLKPFPRTDLYYGYSLPCDDDDPTHVAQFRVGAGYVLSWDLVVWIRDSPIPRNNSIGTEDYLVGEWFKEGDVAKNRPYSMHLFHDHPEQGGSCCRPLSKESILIHKLKSDERWYEVMDFFNASKSLNN